MPISVGRYFSGLLSKVFNSNNEEKKIDVTHWKHYIPKRSAAPECNIHYDKMKECLKECINNNIESCHELYDAYRDCMFNQHIKLRRMAFKYPDIEGE